MTQVVWYLDKNILERLAYDRRGFDSIIESRGHIVKLVEIEDDGLFPCLEVEFDQPTVLFGSHEFVKQINHDGRFQPGHLGVNRRTHATQYMSYLPLDWFLNRDGIFMTWSMFKEYRGIQQIADHWPEGLFIRPDSGFKTFAGQRVTAADFDDHVSTLDQISSVVDDTLILVNRLSNIEGEFRFVIADKQVIAGSEYRWDGKLDVRRDWPQSCWDLAQKVADHEWQVDIAYTCDVALVDGEPRVVELNGFSCAGLYACDLERVVDGVSRAAAREWAGLDLE